MEEVLEQIRDFADKAHGEQMRKYTPERYIVHPVRVMKICREYTDDITVLAAALLHDVGKVESGLRTYGRVIATLSGKVAGADMAHSWRRQRGYARRVGLYLLHADLGADLLQMAGSDPLTVAWTREHHLPPDRWTIPGPIADALKAADDD